MFLILARDMVPLFVRQSTIIGSLAITSLTWFDVADSSRCSDNQSAPRAKLAVRALRDVYVRANIHNVTRPIPDLERCLSVPI
jgi:hypothetical protein